MLDKTHKLFARTPWDHQVEAINRALTCPDGFAFFFEPGLGKTFTAINQLRLDCATGTPRLKRILIVAPVIVLSNWQKEILEFSKFDKSRVKIVFGAKANRLKQIRSLEGGGGILITNYKTLSAMPEVLKELMEWAPEIMVVDESHRLKNLKSKQTKAAVKLSKIAERKYLLTGTPILNTLEDIFAQYLILDGGKTLGKSPVAFKSQYFIDKNKYIPQLNFPKWVEKEGAKEQIHALIAPQCMFVEKETALDLPPLVKTVIEVELSGDTKKAYKDMLKDFVAFIGEISENPTAAVANLVLTRALRLQQIVTGYVPIETADGIKTIHQFKNNPKRDALKELLLDLTPGSKCLVWSVFTENYKDIREVCDELKVEYVEVHGKTKDKNESVRAFNEDAEIRVLIGHPRSGGIGVNLVASDVSIFYSRSFSLENDIQAEARNHRGGSEIHKKITRYDIVTLDTIDVEVMNALQDKKKIGLEVLKGML